MTGGFERALLSFFRFGGVGRNFSATVLFSSRKSGGRERKRPDYEVTMEKVGTVEIGEKSL